MFRTWPVVALALLAASVPARAQKAKYTRTQDVKVDVKLSDRVKPAETPAQPPPRRPEVTATQVMRIEGLLTPIQAEMEAQLLELIRETPDTEVDEKADLYFRLGELYAKQHRFWRLSSIELAMRADAERAPKLKRESDQAAATAKDFLMRTVKTYVALTDNQLYRNYPRLDRALFYLGYTLQSARYYDRARDVYDKLLKNYPSSKFVPEAHLAFGDYFWEKNQLADAEARYRAVLKFPASSAYWYAMYKVGWIHLNLQRPLEALETFFRVAQATRTDAKQELLYRASKKDYVRAYAEIGKADKAYLSFARLDTKAAFDMLGVLADFYLEQGKSDKAIYVYQEMMRTQPRHKLVCLWQYHIAHAMMSLDGASTGDKVREIENLTRLYGALRAKRTLPAAEAQECRDNAAAMSGELARAYHSEAIRTKNVETLGHAQRLYRIYLDVFADAPDAADTEYFYAEALWARAESEKVQRLATEQWRTAADAFVRVVKRGKLDPARQKGSAYAAVLGWKNALDVDPRIEKQAGPIEDIARVYETVPAPLPIPTYEAQMIAAFDLYIAYVKDPNDGDLPGMKFLKGNTFRRYHQFDKAIPLFLDLVAKHPRHETAEIAAQLALDSYNRMQRYDDMLALVDRLDRDKPFLADKPELAGTLERVKVQSLRKKAEQLEKEARATKSFPKFVACGQAYIDIYNRNPEAKDNDEVLYDAVVCFHDGKSFEAALAAYTTLEKYYASSKLYARATARIGKALGDVAFYDQAARRLADYAKKYAGEEDAAELMSESVFFSKGIGDDAKAIENTRFFVRMFGKRKPAEAADAVFSLTSVYEKQGDADGAVKNLREYLRDHARHGGADRRVIANAKIGLARWQQSCPIKQVDGSCVKITRERAVRRLGRMKTAQRTRCGELSNTKVTVIPRDERRVREAMAAFAEAIQASERSKPGSEARHFVAQAKLVQADRDFERYLALAFPSNLNFDSRNQAIYDQSVKRFDTWLVERERVGGQAKTKYDAVLAVTDNATSIAARARLAQISQSLSDALFSAEIPLSVRTGPYAEDKTDAFCDRMTQHAEPLDLAAIRDYGVCLEQSTRLGWFSEWSRMCERELGQIQPDSFPPASELRSAPDHLRPVLVTAPVARLD